MKRILAAVVSTLVLAGWVGTGSQPVRADTGKVGALSVEEALRVTVPAPNDRATVSSLPLAMFGLQPQDVDAYWTPERMASAIPADIRVARNAVAPHAPATTVAPGFSSAALPAGESEAVAGSLASAPSTGQALPAADGVGTNRVLGTPFTRYEVFTPYTAWPYKTVGKVFFTGLDPADGQWKNYVCSGTAVNSENLSTVWTSGHCVHGGPGGTWHRNWRFVPAYKDGTAPYGTWTAGHLWTRTAWIQNGDLSEDLGAAIVYPVSSTKLINKVGGMGLMWGYPTTEHFHAVAYPQASPFNGNRMIVCAAATGGTNGSDIGMGCDMNGGSSGGPLVVAFGGAGGYVDSVISYKFSDDPNSVYGPYQGANAQGLYQNAGSDYLGLITGTVKDSRGVPLSGAQVTVTGPRNVATASDSNGQYLNGSLPDGTYTLTITLDGYRPYTKRGIAVRQASPVTIHVRLSR